MLGDYWVPSREKLVTNMYSVFLANAMIKGYDIIIDNMNLNPKTCAGIEKTVSTFNEEQQFDWKYEIEYKDFFTPLEECIRRDSLRPNPIGEEVIRSTYNRYKNILENESNNQ